MKCAKNPPHHETYLGTRFEVTTSNSLRGDTFTRNVTDRLRYEINIPFKSTYNYAENWLKYLLKYHHLHGLIGANLLISAIKLNASKISRFSAPSVGYYLFANWISLFDLLVTFANSVEQNQA